MQKANSSDTASTPTAQIPGVRSRTPVEVLLLPMAGVRVLIGFSLTQTVQRLLTLPVHTQFVTIPEPIDGFRVCGDKSEFLGSVVNFRDGVIVNPLAGDHQVVQPIQKRPPTRPPDHVLIEQN